MAAGHDGGIGGRDEAAQRIVCPGRDATHRVGDPGAPVEDVVGEAGDVAVGIVG
jgi:hypothetical protein